MKLWVQTTRAVLGSLALAFSTMGIAQAEDAGAQPLSAADQLPPDQEVSETAIELAGWVLASRDAHGYPFAIIDKESA